MIASYSYHYILLHLMTAKNGSLLQVFLPSAAIAGSTGGAMNRALQGPDWASIECTDLFRSDLEAIQLPDNESVLSKGIL